MGKSSGGSSGGGDTTVRYAPYLETAHSRFLDHDGSDEPVSSFVDVFNTAIDASPYGNYESLDVDEGFFGIRTDDPSLTYEIKNFPPLWDMFGKFMAGLDVHDLWGKVYEDVVHGPEIENAVAAQAQTIQDTIDSTIMPRFVGGMRDINAVQSTAFIIGKAMIAETAVREVNKFSAEIRLRAIDTSAKIWSRHLDWSQSVITVYSEIFKLYYTARLDVDRTNLEMESKHLLWNVNLFDYARAMIGAMSGAAAATGANEPSKAQSALGGALSGAAAGYMITKSPIGAVIGGVLGLATSFF